MAGELGIYVGERLLTLVLDDGQDFGIEEVRRGGAGAHEI